jgi:hypothetical protein
MSLRSRICERSRLITRVRLRFIIWNLQIHLGKGKQ